MEYIIVGIGGILGSLTRFSLGKIISRHLNTPFPIATFIINITGAFLLGLVTSIHPGKDLSLLMVDGFLGAYTTFSTFMYEGFQLFQGRKQLNAVIYILGSLFLGIIGFTLGAQTGRLVILR